MFKKFFISLILIFSFSTSQASANNDLIGGLIGGAIIGGILMSTQQPQYHNHYYNGPRPGYNYEPYPYFQPTCYNRVVRRFNQYYGVWENVVLQQCNYDNF